jgi:hypothetical protein
MKYLNFSISKIVIVVDLLVQEDGYFGRHPAFHEHENKICLLLFPDQNSIQAPYMTERVGG